VVIRSARDSRGIPTPVAIRKLARGVVLEDGFKTAPASIKELKGTDKNGWYEVTLYEGHNQQIRKMFDSVGHSVVKLKRTAIGSINYDRLPVGAYRELDAEEIQNIAAPAKQPEQKAAPKERSAKPKPTTRARSAAPKKPFNRTASKSKRSR